jgi:8-oxo-dGTP pyrophosphatase MutT (NUDIX family)
MRALVQAAYVIRRRILALLRLRTRGVKVMLFNDEGELLLIRNSYGDRDLFVLPGGGIGPLETPEAAGAREVREELGIDIRELALLGVYQSASEGKRDRIYLFKGKASGLVNPDPIELEEARYFPLDALPESTSPATLRRIQEINKERSFDGRW